MSFVESVLCFGCEGEQLVGIVCAPQSAACDVGVIVIVGGPQYRVGSHRQFTLLARHLASCGLPTLRFDYRSMGDSSGAARDFLGVDADIAAAITALRKAQPNIRRVVLWGLCDAASAALLYVQATRDPQVAGLVLANPWVRSAASLAQAQVKHYYWKRLRQGEFWRKLLGGGVGLKALRDLGRNLRQARSRPAAASPQSFQDRMAAGLRDFTGPVLLLLSGDDLTAQEFLGHTAGSGSWQGLLDASRLQRVDLPGADHTFSRAEHAREVEARTAQWLLQTLHQP